MSDEATERVSVQLLGIEHVRKSGSLLALISFDLTIAGVAIGVQGAQVRRAPHGQIELTAPMFRSGAGVWLPSVVLPDAVMLELLNQIGPVWPPHDPSRLPEMRTHVPALAFAPYVSR
jgi:hypothetical protein